MSCEFYLATFIFQSKCIPSLFFIRYLQGGQLNFSSPQNNFMTSLYFLFLGSRLSIHSHFHHPDMHFLKIIDCMFLFPVTQEKLTFCSLYVFDPYPNCSTFPFHPFFLSRNMYFFTLFDQVTHFRYIVGKSTPFSIILGSLVS